MLPIKFYVNIVHDIIYYIVRRRFSIMSHIYIRYICLYIKQKCNISIYFYTKK